MNKWIVFILASGVFAVMAQEKLNPVMEKYADDLAFYVNFDDGNYAPVMAANEKSVKSEFKDSVFVPGLFGKALYVGRVLYNAAGNLDFSKPGTLLFWMAPHQWTPVEKEPYLLPFVAYTGSTKIILGRQGGPWGKTRVYVNVETPDRKNWVSNGVGGGSGKDWKNGEWHMIAVTWTPESIGISVDGKTLQEKPLKQTLAKGPSEWMMLACQLKKDGNFRILLDEFAVLTRRLNSEELKLLYEETLRKAKKQ